MFLDEQLQQNVAGAFLKREESVIRRSARYHVQLEAFNVLPQGDEHRALEWRLARIE